MALRLISLTRANENAKLTDLTSYTLIEVASEWLDDNYVLGTYTVDGDGISEDVPVIEQEATAQLAAIFLGNQVLLGNQKRAKERLGDYEQELEYEVTATGLSKYHDIHALMWQYKTKPLQYAPIIGD